MSICAFYCIWQCVLATQKAPGLHPQQHGQQAEGGDSAPLLLSGEAPLQRRVQLWGPQHKKDMDLWERVQRRPRIWSEGWSPSPVRTG